MAKVPKGSFYTYFKSKEDFGIEIIRWHSATFWQKWNEIIDPHATDPLAAVQDCFNAMLADHKDSSVDTFSVVAHVAAEVCESSVECRIMMKSLIGQWNVTLADYIQKAQDLKIARNDIDAGQMAASFWDAWQGSILRVKIEDNLEPVTQCLDLYFGHLMKN